jgi:hypothetical protein
MKTLIAIVGLVIGTSLVVNAQSQTQTQAKPASTTHSTAQSTTQPAAHMTSQPSQHATTQPAAQSASPAQSQTKSMLKISELSKPIQQNLASQFKGWTPVQAYKLDTKGVVSYEVMVKKEANEMRLFYDNAGKYLREEPVAQATPSHSSSAATPAKPAAKPK